MPHCSEIHLHWLNWTPHWLYEDATKDWFYNSTLTITLLSITANLLATVGTVATVLRVDAAIVTPARKVIKLELQYTVIYVHRCLQKILCLERNSTLTRAVIYHFANESRNELLVRDFLLVAQMILARKNFLKSWYSLFEPLFILAFIAMDSATITKLCECCSQATTSFYNIAA